MSLLARKWLQCLCAPALLLAACSSQADMAKPEAVELTATIRNANTRLQIEWTLSNRGDQPLLALTQPLQQDGQPAGVAMYVGQGDDGVVEFALRAFAVPVGLNPATQGKLGAVPLAAGQRLQGRATLPLPLMSSRPYQQKALAMPVDLSGARLCVGVLEAAAKIPVDATLGDGVVATYHREAVASQQRVVCTVLALG